MMFPPSPFIEEKLKLDKGQNGSKMTAGRW